jgi:hypothetical protein
VKTTTHYEVQWQDEASGTRWWYYGMRDRLQDARSDCASERKLCRGTSWRIVRVTSKREVVR